MTITMKEVREEIDLLDKELVLLLARRQKCIEMAALVKNDKNLIIDEQRIEDVISKVTNFGESNNLWINNGAGMFTYSGRDFGNSNSMGVALGDLDNDGDLDAFVTNAKTANHVLINSFK